MFGCWLSAVLGAWFSVVLGAWLSVVFGGGLSRGFVARCSRLLPWLLHWRLSWLLSCTFLWVGFSGWLARRSAGLAGLLVIRRSSYFWWWGQLHRKAGLLGSWSGLRGTGQARVLLVWSCRFGLGLAWLPWLGLVRLPWLSPGVVFWQRNIRTHTLTGKCTLAAVTLFHSTYTHTYVT